ncbi:hypothetical protein J3Q64DRAFT_1833013 [Phycomyces blakesleeanus]|uniref:Uncharacterized protein n=1 Tax=Phycomyces blakesleeanus TaxID=4837 RepID=A0ABR3B2G8_PHYBL
MTERASSNLEDQRFKSIDQSFIHITNDSCHCNPALDYSHLSHNCSANYYSQHLMSLNSSTSHYTPILLDTLTPPYETNNALMHGPHCTAALSNNDCIDLLPGIKRKRQDTIGDQSASSSIYANAYQPKGQKTSNTDQIINQTNGFQNEYRSPISLVNSETYYRNTPSDLVHDNRIYPSIKQACISESFEAVSINESEAKQVVCILGNMLSIVKVDVSKEVAKRINNTGK